MMTSLDGFMAKWQEVQTADRETAKGEEKQSSAAGNAFEIARIKTIDVTREPPKGSREAVFQQIRSRWDISFPQAMLWGVLACAATFAISIVRKRKQGTLLRLQAAPISRTQVLFGKATACFLAVIGVIIMMVALGMFLGMRPRSPVLLAGASVCVAFCFVGVMTLMSVVGKIRRSRLRRGLGRQYDHGHVRRRHDSAGFYAPLYDDAQSGEPREVEHSCFGRRHLAWLYAASKCSCPAVC